MNTNNINIRSEKKEEYRQVENMVRESFWNVYRPGCLEHYVLNQLRDDPAFVKELIPGYLDGITGEHAPPQGYFVDEAEAEAFDKEFPTKEKLKLPGQLF